MEPSYGTDVPDLSELVCCPCVVGMQEYQRCVEEEEEASGAQPRQACLVR